MECPARRALLNWPRRARLHIGMELLMMKHMFASLTMISVMTVSTQSDAQNAAANDLFGFRESSLRCTSTPVSERDSLQGVRVAMKFVQDDDALTRRVIDVGYSTTGEPLYLLAMANISAPDRPFATEAAMVRFGPNNATAGIRMRPDSSVKILGAARADSVTARPRGMEDLSYADAARARALVLRLWNRRCLAPPTLRRP